MAALLLPLAERLGRLGLVQSGVESRYVETPEATIHAYDAPGEGELPTTILLHGIGSAATPFGRVLRRLRRDVRRVVVPDLPGHGFSGSAAGKLTPETLFSSVSSALGTMVDEPSIVVGNSLGGAVALRYALTHPERVRGLVLLSPAGAPSTEDEWASLRGAFDVQSRAEARSFFERVYHRAPWLTRIVAHELPDLLRRPAVRDLLETATNEHAPTPGALAGLSMPVLLVWGKSERLLPDTHLDYFRTHLPDHAIVERPEGVGHCPHIDDPVALASRIASFARDARAA